MALARQAHAATLRLLSALYPDSIRGYSPHLSPATTVAMFSAINIRQDSKTSKIDLGFLGECLLFYETVNAIVAADGLKQIVDGAGMEFLLDLLRSGRLRLFFREKLPAVFTIDQGTARERYDFVYASGGREPMAPLKIDRAIHSIIPDPRAASKILPLIRRESVTYAALQHARAVTRDPLVLGTLMNVWLSAATQGRIGVNPRDVRTWELAKEIQVVSPINFKEVSTVITELHGASAGEWAMPRLLCEILDSHLDIYQAAHLNADVAQTAFGIPLISTFAALQQQAASDRIKEYRAFEELVLGSGNAIRESIDSGARSLADLAVIIEKSSRFRKWLRSVQPDSKFIHEYYRSVTESTWCESLPAKSMRWLITKATGALDGVLPGIGVGAELFDSFVLEKIVRGWRPNQFVDGPLRDFVLGPQKRH